MKRICITILLLCGMLRAQIIGPASPVTASQVTFPLLAGNPVSVPLSTQAVGVTGSTMYFYWSVSEFPIGNSPPYGPFVVLNANGTLSASNYDQIFISSIPQGSSGVDILRTSTPIPPSGTCGCAVATAVGTLTVNDQSNSLNAYTVNTFNPSLSQLTLDNEPVSGVPHLLLKKAGVLQCDLTIGCSATGVTGAGTAGTLAAWSSSSQIGNSFLSESFNGTGNVVTNSGYQFILTGNSTTQSAVLWCLATDPNCGTLSIANGNGQIGLQPKGPVIVQHFSGTTGASIQPDAVTVAHLPAAGAGPAIIVVIDSTAITSEGQTCVGGGSTIALAFSNNSIWKCF